MERHSCVVAPWHHLHRRILQGDREAHVHEGGVAAGPSGLFHASLDGNARRAIELHEGDDCDEIA